MTTFFIGSREIGDGCPPLTIVEAGINHEGSIDKAIALVDAACEVGAELIKFQCHLTEKEMIKASAKTGAGESVWDIVKRCELTEAEERRVQAYCDEKNIIYLSTPFSREAADRLESMEVPAFKIGSGECNNIPLLKHIAAKEKPIILSTGMNDLASVARSVAVLESFHVPYALMHCTSIYPTPYNKVRLGALAELKEKFPQAVIGLSDHSLGVWTGLGAIALGASLVEKHFTVSRSWPGPDVSISIEPVELRDLIQGGLAIWQALGGKKTVLEEEQVVAQFAYGSVVSLRAIRAGEILDETAIWVKRPGSGPYRGEDFELLLGQRVVRDIAADQYLVPGDVSFS